MQGCESWTIKKAKCQRIDAFELWCWRRCLRVPWTARRCNQSILKRKSTLTIHWKDWCWSWSSSTLANWFGKLTLWKKPWCWERWKAAGEGDDRGQDGIADSMDMNLTKLQEIVKDEEAWRAAVNGVTELDMTEWPNTTNEIFRSLRVANGDKE